MQVPSARHPFFAVSKADGRYEIKGLPAGTYTIEVWHERLGTRTQTVTVDGKKGATANVSFKGENERGALLNYTVMIAVTVVR